MYARHLFSFFSIFIILFLSTAKAGFITVIENEINEENNIGPFKKSEIKVDFEEKLPLQNSNPHINNVQKINKKQEYNSNIKNFPLTSHEYIETTNLKNKIYILFKKGQPISTLSFFNVHKHEHLEALEDVLWEVIEILSSDISIKAEGELQEGAQGIIEEVEQEVKENAKFYIQNLRKKMKKKQKKEILINN